MDSCHVWIEGIFHHLMRQELGVNTTEYIYLPPIDSYGVGSQVGF